MTNNFKLILIKTFTIILIFTLGLQLIIIRLKHEKELEKQNKIKISKQIKKDKEKNNALELLSLDTAFNISKLENYEKNSWSGYINFNQSLEEAIKKVDYLIKKHFTIENYNVEYKDGHGNFNLKIRAGD